MSAEVHACDAPIPMVCTIADVCRILQLSPSQYYRLRADNKFPIPEIQPRIGGRARFRGTDVRRYIFGESRRSPLRRSA